VEPLEARRLRPLDPVRVEIEQASVLRRHLAKILRRGDEESSVRQAMADVLEKCDQRAARPECAAAERERRPQLGKRHVRRAGAEALVRMRERARVERLEELVVVVVPGELAPELVRILARDRAHARLAGDQRVRLRKIFEVIERREAVEHVASGRPRPDAGLVHCRRPGHRPGDARIAERIRGQRLQLIGDRRFHVGERFQRIARDGGRHGVAWRGEGAGLALRIFAIDREIDVELRRQRPFPFHQPPRAIADQEIRGRDAARQHAS